MSTASSPQVADIKQLNDTDTGEVFTATKRPGAFTRTLSFAKGGSSLAEEFDEEGKVIKNENLEALNDPTYRAPADLDLMLYLLERRQRKRGQFVELLIYIPFVVVVILWLTFSTQVDDAYWMNWGINIHCIVVIV